MVMVDADSWAAYGIDEYDISDWTDAGIYDASVAGGWVRWSFEPLEVETWAALGVRDPQEAAAWRDNELPSWQAKHAIGAGLSPEQGKMWSRALGRDFIRVADWVDRFGADGYVPASGFVDQPPECFQNPGFVIDWYVEGFTGDDAVVWWRQHFDARSAGAWRYTGLDPFDAADFAVYKFQPSAETALWALFEFTAQEARRWADVGFDPAYATAYRKKGYDPEDAWKANERDRRS